MRAIKYGIKSGIKRGIKSFSSGSRSTALAILIETNTGVPLLETNTSEFLVETP